MNKTEIESASTMKLLSHVFGKQPGQSLQDFAKECAAVKEDSKFIEEVRAHALENATE